MGEYLVTDANLSGNPVVDDLDRQCTFFTADNGRTKFYFYCSHIDFFLDYRNGSIYVIVADSEIFSCFIRIL